MIQLEVWGPYALFSRPELKVEKVSYDVPTPSAARGIVEAVYFHPGLRWHIDRIYVLNPISFTSIRRNEVLSKISARNVRQAAQGGRQELYLAAPQEIVQRSSLLLQDVHYVIEAHFEMTSKAAPSDNPGKFQDIVTRRMEKGQCYTTPYLGCREFSASFRRWAGGPIKTIHETRDLGLLQDVHYVIEAHFEMTSKAAPSDNPGKFQDIVTRRMEKGQCYTTPYLGCREFSASFRRWAGGPIKTIHETRDLGLMLYDFDYTDPQNITPTYFRAKLENGILNVRDCEVFR